MMKYEFEELLNQQSVRDEDWRIIKQVYTWHPAIDNVKGKQQMAVLYKEFGMSLINNLLETALMNERIHEAKYQLALKMDELNRMEETLKAGKKVDAQKYAKLVENQ